MKDHVTFSVRLRQLREAVPMTVQELAEAAGLSRQAVYDLEAGKRDPALSTLRVLAVALGVDLNTLAGEP